MEMMAWVWAWFGGMAVTECGTVLVIVVYLDIETLLTLAAHV